MFSKEDALVRQISRSNDKKTIYFGKKMH